MTDKSDDTMTIELTATTIRPGDAGYDDASTVYVGRKAPALVVRPRDPAQVAEALAYARHHELLVSVRSGGHSGPGFGTNDGGMVIDLSLIDDIEILDRDAALVRLGAGATWGAVAATLGEHGLSLTSGDTKSVGVGGLTSGGGIGWMVRNHGLTIDSVVAVEIVTADGEFHRVDADHEPDLFWAVRGGGGNFGVLTHIEYAAQRVTQVHAGMIAYAVDDVPELLRRWSDAMRQAPEELNTTLVLAPAFGPEMPAAAMGLVCFAGPDAEAAQAAFAPLRDAGPVTNEAIAAKAYSDVLEEAHPPPGVRAMATDTLVRSVDDELIARICEFYSQGRAGRLVFIRALGGALSRVDADATPFAHRDVEALVVGAAFRPEPSTDEELAEAIAPFDAVIEVGVGAYSGFMATATAADLSRIYPPETHRRLVALKRRYDPHNVFRLNFNVPPE
jgi:FAD/FMN-containing dehydrogenase